MAPVATTSMSSHVSGQQGAALPVAPFKTASAVQQASSSSAADPTTTDVPTIQQLLARERVAAPSQHIVARLIAIAESFLFLRDGHSSPDPFAWENDLCSATFYATYALCIDPSSVRARRLLARCARLGGFNVVLPFTPSGSASSATVTATRINSFDNNDRVGAQAAIYILQKGSAATYADAGCAREYREACSTLGRSTDAALAAGVIASSSSAAGKRKAEDTLALEEETDAKQPPQLVSPADRYESQIKTDEAFEAVRRHDFKDGERHFRDALLKDAWNWRALTGLLDLGGETTVEDVLSAQHIAQAYAEREQALAGPLALLSTVMTDGEESAAASVASARPKAGEEASYKKAKMSEDAGSSDAQESTTRVVTRASSVPRPARGAAASSHSTKAPPSSNEARKPANGQSTDAALTRPGLKATSRALSNARTITNQPPATSVVGQDEKSAVKGVSRSRISRTTANPAIPRPSGMQLRSSNSRAAAGARGVSRSAAPSQASSVTSATSTSTTRSTASATSSRSGLSGRRTPATSNGTTTDSASGRSATSTRGAANGTAATGKAAAAASVPTSRTTAASRWAVQANGSIATSRAAPSTAAARKAAMVEEAAQRETARLRAELAEQHRAAALSSARDMTKWLAADLAVFALVRRLGEAYRHVRRFDGESAASVLTSDPIDATTLLEQLENGAQSSTSVRGAAIGAQGKAKGKGVVTTSPADALAASWKHTVIYQCLLGRAYNEMSQYAAAELHFASARKLNPFILAHMDIYSLVLFQLNREVVLSGLAQELTLIEPRSAATQIVVGNAFALQRENQTALVAFQRAAALAPDYAYAYTLAGHEAYDLGSHDQAVAYFRSAIRCDRRHWNAWAGLGRVFLAMGGHELPACQSLQRAISINPKNHVLWDLVGWTYAQIGRKRDALESYDQAISLAPRLAVLTYLRRSELLANEGEDEAAHLDLVRAFELAPEEATIHLLLAQSYMRMGDGTFCELEESGPSGGGGAAGGVGGTGVGGGTIKATGQMRLPAQYQGEITHHLAVAVDLDPGLLKVVKALGEGWRTNPGNRIAMNPAELSGASGYDERYMDYSDISGDVLEDVREDEEGEEEGDEEGEEIDEDEELLEEDAEDAEVAMQRGYGGHQHHVHPGH